jgi:hypothetical protein
MGRPPKPAELRKSNTLRIRLTEAERALIDEASQGQDTSTWARELLVHVAKRASAVEKPRR